jgi:hypothetical protein
MKKILPVIVLLFFAQNIITAQPANQVIYLWPNGAPGFESKKDIPEEAKDWWVKNINNRL